MTEGLLGKSDLSENAKEDTMQCVGMKRGLCRLNPKPPTGNNKESTHMSLVDHSSSQSSTDISSIRAPGLEGEDPKLHLRQL
jgi:hypothetical protein